MKNTVVENSVVENSVVKNSVVENFVGESSVVANSVVENSGVENPVAPFLWQLSLVQLLSRDSSHFTRRQVVFQSTLL